MRALGTDVQVRREVFVIENLRAAGTLDHQSLGNPAGFLGRRRDLRAGLLEPRHAGVSLSRPEPNAHSLWASGFRLWLSRPRHVITGTGTHAADLLDQIVHGLVAAV